MMFITFLSSGASLEVTLETSIGFLNFKWEKFGGDLADDNWIPSKLETFLKGPWSF